MLEIHYGPKTKWKQEQIFKQKMFSTFCCSVKTFRHFIVQTGRRRKQKHDNNRRNSVSSVDSEIKLCLYPFSTRSLWEMSIIQTLDYFLVLIRHRRPHHKNRLIFIFDLFMDLFWFLWIVRVFSCCLFQFNIRSLWLAFHNPDYGFAEQLHICPTGLSWWNSSLVMSTW